MTRRVLVFGAWDDGPGYPRTPSLLRAFADAGWEATLCRQMSTVAGRRKVEVAKRPWLWPLAAASLLVARQRARAALRRELARTRPDLVLVPYPGHSLVRVARAEFRGPILLDLFLSAYDTVVEDRGLVRRGGLAARLLLALDRRACAAADLVLLDTEQHAAHVATLTGLPPDRFACVPIGDPDAPAVAGTYSSPPTADPLRVLFFGTGVPLHGLDVLIRAARRCQGRVHLHVVGGSAADRAAIAGAPARGITVGEPFVPRAELDRLMSGHDLVAGVFGRSDKAQRVVPFKVVHGLAAGRPVITADTPAIRARLRADEEILLSPAGDAEVLALRLLRLADERPRLARIAARARAAYEREFGPAALRAHVAAAVARLGSATRSTAERAHA